MFVYSNEDNVPMTYDFLLEYTGKITAVINDRLFKETGILEITPRAEDPPACWHSSTEE